MNKSKHDNKKSKENWKNKNKTKLQNVSFRKDKDNIRFNDLLSRISKYSNIIQNVCHASAIRYMIIIKNINNIIGLFRTPC